VKNRHFLFVASCCFFFLNSLSSQELFPYSEAASNIGKKVLGIQCTGEGYQDIQQFRTAQDFKFLFGLSSKWMITEDFFFSNHHGSQFPDNFITTSGTDLHAQSIPRGLYYPYRFESMSLRVKYRFLSRDGEHRHIRLAGYVNLAGGNQAHPEAEPDLNGDNSGIGGGLIATFLLHRFSISFDGGGIVPYPYNDVFSGLQLDYGRAACLNVSMGYLLFPRTYKDYSQLGVNLYAEFLCKTYTGAELFMSGNGVSTAGVTALQGGSYVTFMPSVQFIFHSNTRLNLSFGKPLVGTSEIHPYPFALVSIYRNFYFEKKT
jgi:hypothetical protein